MCRRNRTMYVSVIQHAPCQPMSLPKRVPQLWWNCWMLVRGVHRNRSHKNDEVWFRMLVRWVYRIPTSMMRSHCFGGWMNLPHMVPQIWLRTECWSDESTAHTLMTFGLRLVRGVYLTRSHKYDAVWTEFGQMILQQTGPQLLWFSDEAWLKVSQRSLPHTFPLWCRALHHSCGTIKGVYRSADGPTTMVQSCCWTDDSTAQWQLLEIVVGDWSGGVYHKQSHKYDYLMKFGCRLVRGYYCKRSYNYDDVLFCSTANGPINMITFGQKVGQMILPPTVPQIWFLWWSLVG